MRRLLAIGGAAALLAGLTGGSPALGATTYKACVKKSTGEMRFLSKKKCKKGWKKITWKKDGPRGDSGPDGAVGPANSFGMVVDGNGVEVGRSLGVYAPAIAVFSVLIDGGQYSFYGSGLLLPSYSSPYFDNASCAGTGYLSVSDLETMNPALKLTQLRLVYRAGSGSSIGPSRAFKLAGTSRGVLNTVLWRLDTGGTCQAVPPYSGYLLELTEIPAPPDRPGPLRFA